jgi:hypothetical protein
VCGLLGDADFNGAKMIELWGCSVNQPRGSELLSCAIELGLPLIPICIGKYERRSQSVGVVYRPKISIKNYNW